MGRAQESVKKVAISGAKEAVKFLHQPEALEMTIKFVSPNEIKRLNEVMRRVDRETDVLSFPNLNIKAGEIVNLSAFKNNSETSFDGKNVYLGDCALCLQVARAQAKEFEVSLESEVKKLVVHSVLHLLGYDHIEDEDYLIMHEIENKILGETDE